ncbi:hypothetical protein HU200_016475 [Digitaria exilis]|uniref:Uncharacterized protein n=1 Tax=Digitaria exilis TaxID=1010633 RepID=A0A835KJX2_9POAL|nr:hypothetical protein HU200_016475 [Digitaria exilis]
MEDRLRWVLLRAQVIDEEAMGRNITNPAMLQQLDMLRDAMYQGYFKLDKITRVQRVLPPAFQSGKMELPSPGAVQQSTPWPLFSHHGDNYNPPRNLMANWRFFSFDCDNGRKLRCCRRIRALAWSGSHHAVRVPWLGAHLARTNADDDAGRERLMLLPAGCPPRVHDRMHQHAMALPATRHGVAKRRPGAHEFAIWIGRQNRVPSWPIAHQPSLHCHASRLRSTFLDVRGSGRPRVRLGGVFTPWRNIDKQHDEDRRLQLDPHELLAALLARSFAGGGLL